MRTRRLSNAVRTTILVVLGVIWLLPVYLLIVNASKHPADYRSTESWIPPVDFALWNNLVEGIRVSGLDAAIVNTLAYSLIAPAIAVLVGAGIGFAIIVLKLKNGFFWFVLVFAGSVFPLQMIVLPLFDGYSRVSLFDSHLGMVLIYTAISVPFSAFVMRNFFGGIAPTVFEAAVLDGATTWRIFTRIYLPMSSSALMAVFILQATFIWNDLLLGLTLSQTEGVRPIMTTLSAMQTTYGGAQLPTVLAAAILVSAPTVILFLCTQRYFAKGLALGQY